MVRQEQNTQVHPGKDAGVIELLSTKTMPYPLHAIRVTRGPLLARLDEGIERKLTLLSAPAGFGKTTLVSEWIARRGNQYSIAWLSLDEGDNDPVRFWRYLLAACQSFDATIGTNALAQQRAPQPFFDNLLATLINDLARLPAKSVLVLEDYHLITSRKVHEVIAFLLTHLPDTVHVILMARSDPPLPLARLRAYNQLNELHAADLRFSLQEIDAFLQQTVRFPLSAEILAEVEARTEGWVAGLRIIALALQGRQNQTDIKAFLATFSGSHRHILEYLVSEVLTAQPEPLQEFLLQTSFLSHLTGSLCDAVTGREDSALVLEEFERANLFLVPLDDTRQWYRFHALFAEAMQHYARRHFNQQDLCDLYKRASLWYEGKGLLIEAVDTALLAQDFSRAADLIEQSIAPQEFNNEFHTLRRWADQLPKEALCTHPTLCLTYALALLFTSDRHAPETLALMTEPLQMAERHWLHCEDSTKLGEVLALRALAEMWRGNLFTSFATARRALALLSEEQLFWYGIMLLQVGVAELTGGNLEVAEQMLLKAQVSSMAAGNDYALRAATHRLAELYRRQGDLHQARHHFQQVLDNAGNDHSDKVHGWIGLGLLAFEWNDLECAEQYASQAQAVAERLRDPRLLVESSILLARTKHARGEEAQAEQILHTRIADMRVSAYGRELRAWQVQLSLHSGDTIATERWYRLVAQQVEEVLGLQREHEALIAVRLLIAQRNPAAALRLLDEWQDEAHDTGRLGSELEIGILKALAYCASGHQSQAKATILPLLELAQKAGYVRLFLDEGEPMRALLRALLPDVTSKTLATYLRALLFAFAQEYVQPKTAAPSSQGHFVESLSPQEQRVLRLLAAGLSNPEIADELIVSINTIKTQVKSIFRKLDVTRRDDARDLAYQLKLV
jgi:LuxR family transcriptional regulator, maltose regulon positive regulatory protein